MPPLLVWEQSLRAPVRTPTRTWLCAPFWSDMISPLLILPFGRTLRVLSQLIVRSSCMIFRYRVQKKFGVHQAVL